MKKRKLTLSRETLRNLETGQISHVAGASGCPTCADQTCASCYGSCFETCTNDPSCWGSCGGTCEYSCHCI
jgi:hypothetical protein